MSGSESGSPALPGAAIAVGIGASLVRSPPIIK
jgi:hypothetical protein